MGRYSAAHPKYLFSPRSTLPGILGSSIEIVAACWAPYISGGLCRPPLPALATSLHSGISLFSCISAQFPFSDNVNLCIKTFIRQLRRPGWGPITSRYVCKSMIKYSVVQYGVYNLDNMWIQYLYYVFIVKYLYPSHLTLCSDVITYHSGRS